MTTLPSTLGRFAAAGMLATLAACATTQMNLDWRDPEARPGALAGARVLVACRAPDEAARRLCEDQWANQLAARGAVPTRSYAVAGFPWAGGDDSEEARAAVRASGAAVLGRITLSPGEMVLTGGPQIGVGIGGGSGYRGGFSSGGIGITLPVGGGSTTQGLNASASLVDVASGKLFWAGSASAPASGDLASQVAELARVTVEAMRRAGLL